jgi:hypothetical protein
MLLPEFPPHMFERLPDEPFKYGDFPDLSAGAGYFRGFKRPLSLTSLVLPHQAGCSDGMHWDGVPNKTFWTS